MTDNQIIIQIEIIVSSNYTIAFYSRKIISNSTFFQQSPDRASLNYNGPDLDDVKESVRQGVTKVAGRISTMANDVMSSLQDKYGY